MKNYIFILVAGLLVIFASLGLGRFAFGMILPNMQIDLAMSITQSGFVGTSNFLGYLSGLLFAGLFYARYGALKLINRSVFSQGVSMFLMTFGNNYLIVSFFYFFSGFFGALATIAIMSYITQMVSKEIRGKSAGILYMGGGIAIVISGYLVPFLDEIYTDSWRYSWRIFAVLTIMVAIISKLWLKEEPTLKKQTITQKEPFLSILKDRKFIEIGGLYFCFGITYVVYITFFVLASIDKWGLTSEISAPFWIVLGTLSIFSGAIFGILSDKIGRYKTINLVFFIQSIANIIMALNLPVSYLWISASLFGISVWAIPSIMAVLTAETFGVEKTAIIFSKITLIFAFGQIIGPIGAGFITDITNNFSYAFGLSFIITFIAFLLSLKNRNLG